jgi:VWFA-related protein
MELVRRSQNALDSLIAQERRRPARKMVIWISPGWPYLAAPSQMPTAAQEQHIFASVVGLSAALREARILMYSIDPLGAAVSGTGATSFYETFTKGLTKPERAEFGDLGLQVLAAQSGGRAIFGNEEIATSIDRCIAELDGLYTLSIAASPSDRANEYHELTVKLGPAGLKARTRNGYYGQP